MNNDNGSAKKGRMWESARMSARRSTARSERIANPKAKAARAVAPVIGDVLDWLRGQDGARLVRMSGSGATCFALFEDEQARDRAAAQCPPDWWHLATVLR